MKLREVMTSDPETVATGSNVVDAARVMRDADTGIVPIVDGDRLTGVITDRDIAVKVVAHGRDPHSVAVDEVASTNLVTVDPEQNLAEGLRLMAKHQVRRLPVAEEDGRLVGIVSQADVARHADAQKTGQVVEEISE